MHAEGFYSAAGYRSLLKLLSDTATMLADNPRRYGFYRKPDGSYSRTLRRANIHNFRLIYEVVEERRAVYIHAVIDARNGPETVDESVHDI